MKALGDLVIAELPETEEYVKQGNDGVTYVQLIQTSSITVHTVHSRRSVHFDMISCRDFDARAVSLLLRGLFRSKQVFQRVWSR
jgi:S-adenosylmethionine/arginine decarboxylase-like enzyme